MTNLSDVLTGLGRPIAYHPGLAKILGVKETVFLCQLVYWDGKQADTSGWIYKTQEEWEDETGLSAKEQRTARINLKASGLLEEREERLRHRMFYKVNFDKLNEAWETTRQDGEFPKLPTGTSGSDEGASRLTETTSETTTTKSPPPSGGDGLLFQLDQEPEKKPEPKPKKEEPKAWDAEVVELSNTLTEIVCAQKKVQFSPSKVRATRDSIDKLHRIDGIEYSRIRLALDWYRKNVGGQYVVVIESGASLREKFLRLEAGAWKSKGGGPQVKRSAANMW